MDKLALKLTTSLEHDVNIWQYDILVDIAHVFGLLKQQYINEEEAKKIIKSLLKIMVEVDRSGKLPENGEDIHEAIEAEIIKTAGEAGMKIHTGRSRNDEVATCLRMFARDGLLALAKTILELREVLISKAKENLDVVMPGFTHLQYAQPTKLAHHLIAFHDSLCRDFERCLQAFNRVNLCPLGSAAFASTQFKLDREYVAKLLGFNGIVENSEDGSASRDFLIECVFLSAESCLNLSRIAEEIILWSSEFDFLELPDEFASSSSIMPQKKNPDVAEIIRAKAGKLIGNITASMSIYKAMPMAYNRDFQEMNPILYDSLKDSCLCFKVMANMLKSIEFKKDIMEAKAGKGFSVATHIAEELVKKGVPFRKAHKIVGKFSVGEIDYDRFVKILKEEIGDENVEKYLLDEDTFKKCLDVKEVVDSRDNMGGTSKKAVEEMLNKRTDKLREDYDKLKNLNKKVSEAIDSLKEKAIEFL